MIDPISNDLAETHAKYRRHTEGVAIGHIARHFRSQDIYGQALRQEARGEEDSFQLETFHRTLRVTNPVR